MSVSFITCTKSRASGDSVMIPPTRSAMNAKTCYNLSCIFLAHPELKFFLIYIAVSQQRRNDMVTGCVYAFFRPGLITCQYYRYAKTSIEPNMLIVKKLYYTSQLRISFFANFAEIIKSRVENFQMWSDVKRIDRYKWSFLALNSIIL